MTDIERLTTTEATTLAECEAVIETNRDGFIRVAEAMATIRDERLYRRTHATFEDYCKERWGFTRMRASQVIAAADTIGNLSEVCKPWFTNERQLRELANVDPEEREAIAAEVIDRAPRDAEGKPKVTAKLIREVVSERESVGTVERDIPIDDDGTATEPEPKDERRARADEATASFRGILSLFRQVKSAVKELRQRGDMAHVTNSFEAAVIGVERTVKDAMPYATCPHCGGKGCAKCLSRGWLIRVEFGQLAKREQAKAVVL